MKLKHSNVLQLDSAIKWLILRWSLDKSRIKFGGDQNDITIDRALDYHMTNKGLIPNTPQGPLCISGTISEHRI